MTVTLCDCLHTKAQSQTEVHSITLQVGTMKYDHMMNLHLGIGLH